MSMRAGDGPQPCTPTGYAPDTSKWAASWQRHVRQAERSGGIAMAQDEQDRAAQEAPTERPEGEAERAGEEVQPVDVYGILGYCIALLQAHAWQSMGLLPNPA